MQFPESWLRAFCNPPIGTQELADLLTMSGMEVEELRPVAPPFSGVVVAEILTAEQHPQADRLRVCTVDAGPHSKDGPLQIVCGAPNARAGIKVPLALVGAMLPPGDDGKAFSIGVGKLRGVESRGMLCSARELKIADDHGGLLELAGDAPVGVNLREHLQLDDTLFTLKLTPNLAHGLSVYGVAREVAALTGAPLHTPAIAPVTPGTDQRLPVRVEAADLCGRFSGRVIRAVNTRARTPQWMVDRLARCGQRSVTALVDISNYVMFEFGRPSHIFDLDKIHSGLVVRWGRDGEALKLLNGNTITVDGSVGVIADDVQVESLAGIMGGDATAVSDDTRNIYVEAAFWWPEAVQGRSRRYGFSTDAGHRFERGVDPALTVAHIERITQLVLDICGTPETTVGPIDDQVLRLPEARPVTLRVARAAQVIGMPVAQAQCEDVFRRLGLAFTSADGRVTVTPPSWRFDLAIEEDLIEEVARVVGYDKLPSHAPLAPVTARVQREGRRSAHGVRHALAALGYQETISYSFVEARWEHELAGNADPIAVLNPIAAPLAVMRSSLLGSLVGVLRHNLARKAQRVRVFEVGRVYRRDAAATDARGRAGLWPGRPGPVGPSRRSGGLLRREGRPGSPAGAAAAAVRARHASGAAPRPLRRGVAGRTLRGPRGRTAPAVAPGLRAAAGAGAVRVGARCRAAAPSAGFRAGVAPAAGVARHRAGGGRDCGARRTDGHAARRPCWADPAGHALRHLQASAGRCGFRIRRAQPGGAAGVAGLRDHAHRRPHPGLRGRGRGACPGGARRAAAQLTARIHDHG
jgi:phenylalanyl-tRNA synthetase beta chain